jgi:hypothetical protein
MYAMTCFDNDLFPEEEALHFASGLFTQSGEASHPAMPHTGSRVRTEDGVLIRNHITGLYRHFLSKKNPAKPWGEPLLDFLRNDCPAASMHKL